MPILRRRVDRGGRRHEEIIFPVPLGPHYQSCTLWSSDYAVGPFSFSNWKNKGDWLRDLHARAHTSVPLPAFAKRVEWKVEAQSGSANECELYKEHG